MPEVAQVRVRRGGYSLAHKAVRVAWGGVWLLLYRPSPRPLHAWRRFLLRLFGASIAQGAHPYPSARIWAPWNLTMGPHSCIGDHVDCYSVDRVTLGSYALVSQYAYLCTASHDFEDPAFPLVISPITIAAEAWVCACVYVGPGVTVGEGAVVGARSGVFRDVEPWTVVAGTPAKYLKNRSRSGARGPGQLEPPTQ